MFNIGDVVVYSSQGICKIESIESKQIGKQIMNYYVLRPFLNRNTTVFVPIDNQTLSAKMLNVLSGSEAKALIKAAPEMPVIKFVSENQKREQYKNILAGGKREELLSLIKTIRYERENRRAVGKKLSILDEQTLSRAEALIFNEIAFVLSVTVSQVQEMITF